MNATLYCPNQEPKPILRHNFTLPSPGGYAKVTAEEAEFLGCRLEEVDILVTGPKYTVYSVFDSTDEINLTAMAALKELVLDTLFFEEDEVLRGNILIVYIA
jgi:hypothetical protein